MKKLLIIGLLVAVSSLNAIELELSGAVQSDNQKMITSRYLSLIHI